MTENTVYVGRPTVFGNPYIIGKLHEKDSLFPITQEQAVAFYWSMIIKEKENDTWFYKNYLSLAQINGHMSASKKHAQGID